jgi:hypothetical protein
MNVYLHVDRLVLDGLDTPGSRAEFARGVESELARLVVEEGIVPRTSTGRALATLQGPDLAVPRSPQPTELARGVARSAHSALNVGLGGSAQ